MKLLLLAASLLAPSSAFAQAESDIREAAGKIKKCMAEAQAVRPAPAP